MQTRPLVRWSAPGRKRTPSARSETEHASDELAVICDLDNDLAHTLEHAAENGHIEGFILVKDSDPWGAIDRLVELDIEFIKNGKAQDPDKILTGDGRLIPDGITLIATVASADDEVRTKRWDTDWALCAVSDGEREQIPWLTPATTQATTITVEQSAERLFEADFSPDNTAESVTSKEDRGKTEALNIARTARSGTREAQRARIKNEVWRHLAHHLSKGQTARIEISLGTSDSDLSIDVEIDDAEQ